MSVDRRIGGALASGAFRLALALALLFAAGSALLYNAVRQLVGGYAADATVSLLRDEAFVLTGEYRALGQRGLIDAMARHSAAGREAQFRYLLVDRRGDRLYGSLPLEAARPGWGVSQDPEPDGTSQPLRRLGVRLPNGLLLVVATDAFDIASVRDRLIAFTGIGGIAVTLVALIGGFAAGRLFLARLDRVNEAVERIIEGDRVERLPSIGVAPEFGRLTDNLNRMIDRQAAAVEGLRQVSTAIAHDLRTPLALLRGDLEAARERDGADREVLEAAIAQTDAILTTFQALLRIGMLEGGVGRQRFAPVDLADLLGRLHRLYLPLAEDAGHRFDADIATRAVVMGDAALLSQLFTNVIENAIGHTPAGTRVGVRLREDGGTAVATIVDDGPGVPTDELPHLFRRFYRGDASRGSPGSGLGLALVAAIADLHGATVAADALAPGLSLTVRFPVADGRC